MFGKRPGRLEERSGDPYVGHLKVCASLEVEGLSQSSQRTWKDPLGTGGIMSNLEVERAWCCLVVWDAPGTNILWCVCCQEHCPAAAAHPGPAGVSQHRGDPSPAVLPCGTTSMVCRLGLVRVLARSRCSGAGGWGSGSAPVLPGGMLKEKAPLGGGSGAWSLGSPGANVVISQTKSEHLTGVALRVGLRQRRWLRFTGGPQGVILLVAELCFSCPAVRPTLPAGASIIPFPREVSPAPAGTDGVQSPA